MKAAVHCLLPVLGLALSASVTAQVWTEQDDAWSFPDGAAQVTRGDVLESISGSTGAADLRDAYCIKITDPGSFQATTDPATDSSASADFDTRLFLFRPDGAPVLANDDTAGQASSQSTLTGTATDGSGFVLTQPGDYVLIVAGSPDLPQDSSNINLFDIDSDLQAVHAANPISGRFEHWLGVSAEVGDYTVSLAGVTTCQEELDAVFSGRRQIHLYGSNAICLGDDEGGLYCYDIESGVPEHASADVALGFVDADPHLDAIFANTTDDFGPFPDRVCLGDGLGNLTCSNVSTDSFSTHGVALGFVNGDQHLDAVFATASSMGQGPPNRVCLGDSTGAFSCSDASTDSFSARHVALGFVDGDRHLDAVFATGSSSRICLGDGTGAFACSGPRNDTSGAYAVALGFVDGDRHLDAVFATASRFDDRTNRVCLGDGTGDFACSDTSDNPYRAYGVALGFVDGDRHLDAVFAYNYRGWPEEAHDQICLGDGSGGFSCSDMNAISSRATDVAMGLVNADSHLDAVLAVDGYGVQWHRVCIGNGNGDFSCSRLAYGSSSSLGVAMGEIGRSFFFNGFESGDTSAWSQTVP